MGGTPLFKLLKETSFTPYAYDKKSRSFAQGLDFLRFQVAIYTVFHEESESGVEKYKILEPGGKCWKNSRV